MPRPTAGPQSRHQISHPRGTTLDGLADRIDQEHSRLICDVAALVGVCIHAMPVDTRAGEPQVRQVLIMIEDLLDRVTDGLEAIASEVRQTNGAT